MRVTTSERLFMPRQERTHSDMQAHTCLFIIAVVYIDDISTDVVYGGYIVIFVYIGNSHRGIFGVVYHRVTGAGIHTSNYVRSTTYYSVRD